MTMKRVPTSIQTVIRHALKTGRGAGEGEGDRHRNGTPGGIGEIPLDADRMSQVLLNLVLNAIAAMDAGGTIRVSLARHDDRMIRIAIADTGAGIRQEDLSRVFDPYFTTKPSGTGLGLPIVQKIVEAHGGEIRLESEPGQGNDGNDPSAVIHPGRKGKG